MLGVLAIAATVVALAWASIAGGINPLWSFTGVIVAVIVGVVLVGDAQ